MKNIWSYGEDVSTFLGDDEDKILGKLYNDPKLFCVLEQQREAWKYEVKLLKKILVKFNAAGNRIYFEYNLMRFSKRVDVVLVLNGILICLEFKTDLGVSSEPKAYLSPDKKQVFAYADEFSQFHSTSRNCPIVPVLVVPNAKDMPNTVKLCCDNVFEIMLANETTLMGVLVGIIKKVPQNVARSNGRMSVITDVLKWEKGEYQTVPTIVEAAGRLFENQSVEAITRAGTDVAKTMNVITKIIRKAEKEHDRVICFVTGEPGAGKTLVGLKLAAERMEVANPVTGGDPLIRKVLLSGNYPLVKVLKESLVRNFCGRLDACLDRMNREKKDLTKDQWAFVTSSGFTVVETKKNGKLKKELETIAAFSDKGKSPTDVIKKKHGAEIEYKPRKYAKTYVKSTVSSMIQMVSNFRYGWEVSKNPPAENVFIFDEAQRAWSAEQVKSKDSESHTDQVRRGWSEPRTLLRYLNRHSKKGDWCVAVALVGEGQDIHVGEAGIEEWYKALSEDKDLGSWKICAPARVIKSKKFKKHFDKNARVNAYTEINYSALHLSETQRSFRSQAVGRFVNALLKGRSQLTKTKSALSEMKERFPVFITHDEKWAREWLRKQSLHGERRYGSVVSSRALRLRPSGFLTQSIGFDEATWFLDDADNINSSNALELSATEFKIQGLELDYVLVGWDGDLWFDAKKGVFLCRQFSVKKNAWIPVKDVTDEDEDKSDDADGSGAGDIDPKDKDRHLRNAYRVLLTRARQGMVIYIPKGDEEDATISNLSEDNYKSTYAFLRDEVKIDELPKQ